MTRTRRKVHAVHRSDSHTFSKTSCESIHLLTGLGVEGDAHLGKSVQHRSRVADNPSQPNLRQVHLIHYELIEELKDAGFEVAPGTMGENVTTQHIDLLALPKATMLKIGNAAIIEVTGLRNPCAQLDHFQKGLAAAVLDRDREGNLIRKAGIMAIVKSSGTIYPDDEIQVQLPDKPFVQLERV